MRNQTLPWGSLLALAILLASCPARAWDEQQLPDINTMNLDPATVAEVEQKLRNLQSALEEAQAEWDDLRHQNKVAEQLAASRLKGTPGYFPIASPQGGHHTP
jgi:hypothetical protein